MALLKSTSKSANNFEKLASLQEILYFEEKAALQEALKPQPGYDSRGLLTFSATNVHPLTLLHSNAVYQKGLTRLMELETLPLLYLIKQKVKENEAKVKELKDLKNQLEMYVRNKKTKGNN